MRMHATLHVFQVHSLPIYQMYLNIITLIKRMSTIIVTIQHPTKIGPISELENGSLVSNERKVAIKMGRVKDYTETETATNDIATMICLLNIDVSTK